MFMHAHRQRALNPAAHAQAAGRNVSRTGFPRRDTSTGRMLDTYLRAKEKGVDLDAHTLHTLFAANRYGARGQRLLCKAKGSAAA